MRTIIIIALFGVLFACNPDGAGCFKASGPLTTENLAVADFTAIDISGNIEVRIAPGAVQQVKITTGSNLQAGIRVEVEEGVLYLDNLNTCNWTRNYINPVVEVTVPLLERLTLRGSGNVVSTDTLVYERLKLENLEGSGDFYLDVKLDDLNIVANSLANFYIAGTAQQLSLWFYWNDGIYFGENLQAVNCQITHYGSNTFHVNVLDSIYGGIYSFGNVIMHRQIPRITNVSEDGEGQLLFEP